MTTREDELVRDTERTRAELASDLEALGDRVAPKKVVARGKAQATEKVEELGEKASPRRILKRQTGVLRDRFQGIQESVRTRGGGRNDDTHGGVAGGARRRPLAQRPAPVPRSVAGQVRAAQSPDQPSKTGTVARPVVAGLVVVGAGVLIARLMGSKDQDEASQEGGGVGPGRPRSGRKGEPEPERRARKAPARAEQGGGTPAQRTGRRAAGNAPATERTRRTAATASAPTATKADSAAAGAARKAPSRAVGTAKQRKAQPQGPAGTAKAQAKRSSSTVKKAAKRPARATKAAGPS